MIGAGPAGCVVARRAADQGATVALIETGLGLPLPAALRTIDAIAAFSEPDRFWAGFQAANGPAESVVPYRLGRGIGGGSSVNTLAVTAGDRSDYDRWSTDHNANGWAWADLEPFHAAVIDRQSTTAATPGPLAAAVALAAVDAGHAAGAASTAPDAHGVRPAALFAAGGKRFSAIDGYLRQAPEQLRVVTGRPVARILVRNGSARGVAFDDGTMLDAGRVVVSAGAVHTPWLLTRSGLIDSTAIFGVEDHPSFVFTVALRSSARQDPDRPAPAVSQILRWPSSAPRLDAGASSCADGLDAGASSCADGLDAGASSCDLMALVMDHVGTGTQGRAYGAVIVTLTDVDARGRLDCRSGPGPRFRPGWLDVTRDRQRLRAGVRHVAELVDSPSVRAVAEEVAIDDEGAPLASIAAMSDDQLDAWMVAHPGPVAHVAATCPLGGAIVDEQGRLRGLGGLHVIDGSVLPHLPNANPMLPIMFVAEALVGSVLGR